MGYNGVSCPTQAFFLSYAWPRETGLTTASQSRQHTHGDGELVDLVLVRLLAGDLLRRLHHVDITAVVVEVVVAVGDVGHVARVDAGVPRRAGADAAPGAPAADTRPPPAAASKVEGEGRQDPLVFEVLLRQRPVDADLVLCLGRRRPGLLP